MPPSSRTVAAMSPHDETIAPEGTESEEAFGNITIAMDMYWSRYHLHAARMFARKSAEFEAITGRYPFSFGHRACVMGAINSAAMFAEAALNEIKERADQASAAMYFPGVALSERSKLASITKFGAPPFTDRPNRLLNALGRTPFRKDDEPLKSFDLLVLLRNSLVHSKPERVVVGEPDTRELVERLVRVGFALNNRMASGLLYPDQILSAGCAKWAIGAACSLLDELHRRLGVERPDFDQEHSDD
jgi:hypothetical protein